MLDQRPIQRYMLGFPPGIQENIMRTVENQLEEMAKDGIPGDVAEEITEKQLKDLRNMCKKFNPISISYENSLAIYLMALGSDSED